MTRTAEGSTDRGVQQRLQTAFDEIQVGGANSGFLGERLFELASLELELGLDPDVEINVAHNRARGGVSVGQDGVVEVRAIIALESEASAPDHECI